LNNIVVEDSSRASERVVVSISIFGQYLNSRCRVWSKYLYINIYHPLDAWANVLHTERLHIHKQLSEFRWTQQSVTISILSISSASTLDIPPGTTFTKAKDIIVLTWKIKILSKKPTKKERKIHQEWVIRINNSFIPTTRGICKKHGSKNIVHLIFLVNCA